MCDVSENENPRKRMKLARETSLEEALLKWNIPQISADREMQLYYTHFRNF